ncbi:hypothetical protein Godav_019705, partial [Gossypium davidsonii]|nr:hypothetical protein [Gossypium davidsonii]
VQGSYASCVRRLTWWYGGTRGKDAATAAKKIYVERDDVRTMPRSDISGYCAYRPRLATERNDQAHVLATEGLKRREQAYLVGEVPEFAVGKMDEDRRLDGQREEKGNGRVKFWKSENRVPSDQLSCNLGTVK